MANHEPLKCEHLHLIELIIKKFTKNATDKGAQGTTALYQPVRNSQIEPFAISVPILIKVMPFRIMFAHA